jgi:predicted DNA-binding transcriptional regulator YafY
MAKQRRPTAGPAAAITFERAIRIYRLLCLLAESPLTRPVLIRRLGVGVRDFYRDLEILRTANVRVMYHQGKYSLATGLTHAQAAMPFPNPGLTLGEVEELAHGRSAVHRQLREQVKALKAAASPRPTKRRGAG